MRRRVLFLVVWYVSFLVLLLVIVARAEAAVPAGWTSAPHLTQVARALTAPHARVYCGYRQLGAAGEAWKEAQVIALAPDVCTALKVKRPITPEYPRVSTGEAVFTLAHEAGHLVTPGERWRRVRRTATRLGRGGATHARWASSRRHSPSPASAGGSRCTILHYRAYLGVSRRKVHDRASRE